MDRVTVGENCLVGREVALDNLKIVVSWVAIAALFSGCASQGATTANSDGPVSAYAATRAQSSDPTEFRPVSADYRGTLTPATGIANVIAGKTLVIVQPWVDLKGYELREGPIYFRSDGFADSSEWINTKWNIDGSESLCLNGHSTDYCFKAFEDDAGQAYLMRSSDHLLSKVASIEDGDSHNVKELYEANVRAQQQKAQFQGMLIGMLASAVLGGGLGGGGGGGGGEVMCPGGARPNNGRCPGDANPTVVREPAASAPPIGDLYSNGPQHGFQTPAD